MTEKPNARRTPAGQFNWLWMIISVLAVGGFMAWLAANSEPGSAMQVVEDEDQLAEGGMAVTLADLAVGTDALMGQLIRIEDVRVASRLGGQAFWTTLPNNTPFLIRLNADVVGGGFAVQSGDVVTVTGRLNAMSDSVLAEWQQAGVLTDEGQRMEAEFAILFVEASRAVRTAAGGAGGGDAGAVQ